MTGSSPFDEMLAEGRRQLDEMTGRTGKAVPVAGSAADATPADAAKAPRSVTGTTRGVPFRLNLHKDRGT